MDNLIVHDHINYGGQQVPLRYCYAAKKAFQMETGKKPTLELIQDPEMFEIMTWHAVRAGYRFEGKENPFTREDMADLIGVAEEVAISQEPRLNQTKKKQ